MRDCVISGFGFRGLFRMCLLLVIHGLGFRAAGVSESVGLFSDGYVVRFDLGFAIELRVSGRRGLWV